MKKFLIAAAVLVASLSMNAEVFNVGTLQKVETSGIIDKPVLSADGSFVVAKGAKGLDKINLANGAKETLVEGQGLYNVAITPDGSNVVYTRPSFNKNHLRYNAVERVNIANGKKDVLVKASRNLSSGAAVTNGTVSVVNNGRMQSKAIGANTSDVRPVVAIYQGHLTVTHNGKTVNIDPQGRGSYLWPSLSPDGTKIVYWCVYRGCFVCNLDGSDARPLGNLRAAVWAGNDAIIGMKNVDDEEGAIKASSLVAADIATGETQVLTPESVVAVFPSVNASATRVAFNDIDGNLYYFDINK